MTPLVSALLACAPPDGATAGAWRAARARPTGDTAAGCTTAGLSPPTRLADRREGVSVATGDFDGDGRDDWVAADDDGFAVALQSAPGTFTEHAVPGGCCGVGHARITVADLDGDGDPDLVFAEPAAVATNPGDGRFGPAVLLGDPDHRVVGWLAADLDGDGDLDLAGSWTELQYQYTSGVDVLENLGGGAFAFPTSVAGWAGRSYGQLAATDADGDGDLDLVLAEVERPTRLPGPLVWLENRGGRTFGAPVVVNTTLAAVDGLGVADLDGDGDDDLVVADSPRGALAWIEGGAGFGAEHVLPPLTAPLPTATDLDGDRRIDLVVSAAGTSEVSFLRNLGGTFDVPAAATGRAQTYGTGPPAVADLDADGRPDLVTAAHECPTVLRCSGVVDGWTNVPVPAPCPPAGHTGVDPGTGGTGAPAVPHTGRPPPTSATTGDTATSGPKPEPRADGCGCDGVGGAAGGLSALVALAARRRIRAAAS